MKSERKEAVVCVHGEYESREAAVDVTKRLYETEPRRRECTAQVQSCVQGENGWLVQLDQTVLFPEGGGQLCDRGTIEGVPVQAVYEEEGQIIHLCSAPLQAGSCVTVELDHGVRLYHSQQHTGEHMLSHAFWKLYGAKNIGFHSDEQQITIDLDKELDREQCAQAERYANEQIWRDAKVSILYRDRDHMDDLDVRKVTQKVDGVLRVVVIEGGDVCTCCGTHVERTGEVGMIKILSVQRHRGGTRLEAVCGRAALEDYVQKSDLVYRLSCALSCGTDTMEERIEALKAGERELGAKLRELSARLMEYVAADALQACPEKNGNRCVMVSLEGDGAEAKQLLNHLTQGEKTIAGVFFAQGDRVGYMIAKTDEVTLSCREAAAQVNLLLDGKGGGTDRFVQGSGKRGPNWRELVRKLETHILDLM